jgi:two-component system, NtrC family, sensor histidine kinase HydH
MGMQPASELGRRARYHALHSPPAELTQHLARNRQLSVLALQVLTLMLLAWGGFPPVRLAIHAGVCLFYVVACRSPSFPIAERTKMRLLAWSLLSYGAWLVNTGGLMSPLLPLGLGMILPALMIFDTRVLRFLFAGGALLLLVAATLASASWPGTPSPPLAPVGSRPSVAYLAIMAGSIVVTVINVANFWAVVTSAYAKVAVELGTRREELCTMGEDRVRELEGAAAKLAHDMKNPLASIKALSAHLVHCPTLDPRTVQRLEVVSTEADHLEAIVDSFLSLSRGLCELQVGRVRPHQVASELKLLLDERAAQAGVVLEVTGDTAVEVSADARKLQRALFYLTMNAIQASMTGKVVTIDVGRATATDGVVMRVIDRGEGMCRFKLERLQKPPYSTRQGGSGLGVAVARALIDQHGGHLTFESVAGGGTTVTVELPGRPPQGPAALRLPSDISYEPIHSD